MAPRFDRLTRQKDFDTLKRRGTSGNSRFVTVRFSAGGQTKRLAVIVSHKVSKKAVARNKVRRRVRAILSELPNTLLRNGSLLVIARPNSDTAPYATLKEGLLRALEQARVLTT